MNVEQVTGWLPSFLIPFVSISYPVATPAHPDSFPNSSYYNNGPLDLCFIVTCIAVMAIVRDSARLGVFEPFSRWKLTRDRRAQQEKALPVSGIANGNEKSVYGNGTSHTKHSNGEALTDKEERRMRRSVLRFAEQGYSCLYYTFSWSFGLYVHINLPTDILKPTRVWYGYPHIPLAGPVKTFYLTQGAFYLHQILILNAEARRKDHWQMLSHHIITVVLLTVSYFYNFTRVGCMIMVTMDWCDIFLPLAKMLRYINMIRLCDITFTFFLVSWLITRHVIFFFAVKSTYYDLHALVPYGWDPERNYYFVKSTYIIFVTMLGSLQILQFVWSWMIFRVAWRVVRGSNAEDDRSDDEGEKKRR